MPKRALLVEVDYDTGERAGDVDPRDPALQSYGWQNLPDMDGPDVEIRVVEDDRPLDEFEDTPGVRVLRGVEEINEAIAEYIPARYEGDIETVREWLRRQGRDVLMELDRPRRELYEEVHGEGGPVRKDPSREVSGEENDEGKWGRDIQPRDAP